MPNIIKSIAVIIAGFLLASCNRDIKFPDGGYKYPVVLTKTLGDSFRQTYWDKYWDSVYDEPDLKLKPLGQTTIRLIYETAFGEMVIITMTENELVIKRPYQGDSSPGQDSTKLNDLERFHFRILQRYFPIQEMDAGNYQKVRNDSLAKIYPKLLDPNYYKYLLDKSRKVDSIPFKYDIKKVKITTSKYEEIVGQINSSGYWKLPLQIDCDHSVLDGYGFELEINTPEKYNLVALTNCPEKALEFSKACQAIIDAANLDQKIRVMPDN